MIKLNRNVYVEAADRMLARVQNIEAIITDLKLYYRKDKSIVDVKEALRKGLKSGKGKREYEVEFVSVYLQKVLKRNKPIGEQDE